MTASSWKFDSYNISTKNGNQFKSMNNKSFLIVIFIAITIIISIFHTNFIDTYIAIAINLVASYLYSINIPGFGGEAANW